MPRPMNRFSHQTPRCSGRAISALALTALFVMLTRSGGPSVAQAPDPCVQAFNEIVCENQKPGDPDSEWDITGAGDSSIQGFATDISVDQGQTVFFKIDTTATALSTRHLSDGLLRRAWARGRSRRFHPSAS